MKDLYVVLYTHRFGADAAVFSTRDLAVAYAQALAERERNEIIDQSEPDWANWLEQTGGEENIEIVESSLDPVISWEVA